MQASMRRRHDVFLDGFPAADSFFPADARDGMCVYVWKDVSDATPDAGDSLTLALTWEIRFTNPAVYS